MQDTRPSLGKITLFYLGFYLLMAVLINIVLWAAEYFAGWIIQPSSIGWLPLILGAMFAGQHYGTRAGAKPPQGYAWMAGLLFTSVSVAVSMLVFYVIAVAMGFDTKVLMVELLAQVGNDAGLILGILGGFMLLIWVLQRFAFSMGAGQAVKQAERLAAKGK